MKLINFIGTIGIIAMAGSGDPLPAQEPGPLMPTPPYVAPIPRYCHWQVSLKYSEGAQGQKAASESELPAVIDTVKTDDIRRVMKLGGTECFHYQNGREEAWIAVDTMLPVATGSNGVMAYFQFFQKPTKPIDLAPERALALRKVERDRKAFLEMR